MRFIPVLLLAYVMLALQSGLAPFIAMKDSAPNLLLPLVIFIALYAPREPALIGVFILGLMQDMLSTDPLGVNPIVYAVVAFATRATQPAIHREHFLTHIVVGILGASLQAVILYFVGVRLGQKRSVEMLMNSAIYTVVLTPILLRILIAMRKLFAFQPDRKKSEI